MPIGSDVVTKVSQKPPVVWIIDAEQWPRAYLRAELIERGFDAVGYLSVDDALETISWRFPNLAVIELRGVARREVELLFKAGVPVIGIVSHPAPDWLGDFPWATLLHRPVSIGEIADAVGSGL